jgi:hypothetical protein
MTKTEVLRAKEEAKKRNNRRLDASEFARIQAILKSESEEIPMLDLDNNISFKQFKPIKSAGWNEIKRNPKYAQMKGQIERALDPQNTTSRSDKTARKNRRMSDTQFRKMMKLASVELGINDNKGLPVLDLVKSEVRTNKEIIEAVLQNIAPFDVRCTKKDIRDEYLRLIRGRKLSFADQLGILFYLAVGKRPAYKPMCLLSKEEKQDRVRKGIIKPRGDIKERPVRFVPDETLIAEIQGKPRSQKDAFDKLGDNKKVEWARYANLVLKTNISDVYFKTRIQSQADAEVALFAMKYACKMSKIPEFKGVFRNPWWILYRVFDCNNMTQREFSVYNTMLMDHLGLLKERRTIPIISSQEAIKRLLPEIKRENLYKQYKEVAREQDSSYNLKLAKTMLTKGT